ncbi:MAG: pilus assembly protein N-terminal domain-containing protein [Rhodomicrobiaceae bacterium]
MILLTAAPRALFAGEDTYVDVIIDQARLIRLKRDTTQIIIGNPAIADASAQDSRLLVITGKSYGMTNLIALDAEGREIFRARLAVREGDARQVTLYRGTSRQSYYCAPDCQRTLSLGDDKAAFEQLAGTVSAKFGVVNSAIGAK